MEFSFPLLEPRQGDRHYYYAASPVHHATLDVPESKRGRIRLQLTIPWITLKGGRYLLTVALVWPKIGPDFPMPHELAAELWKRLTEESFERTEQRGLAGALLKVPVRFKRWPAELFIRKQDWKLARSLAGEEGHDATFVCLTETLAWAFRFFHRSRWPREQDKFAWVYRAHRLTALLVADEVAELYLTNAPSLSPRKYLDEAHPRLARRIAEAYRHPTITPRRLALALVEVKFEKLLGRLLNRSTGLDDARLWSIMVPPASRSRLLGLLPTQSVVALRSLPKAVRQGDHICGFLHWWDLLVNTPLRPLYPPTDVPIKKRSEIAFLELPGVEHWASVVEEALYR